MARTIRRISNRPSNYQHKTIPPQDIKKTTKLAVKKARKQPRKRG